MSTDKPTIPSGYVLYARAFIDLLADAPLLDRVLWTWLLCKANHKDRPGHPNTIRRGQLVTTIQQICHAMQTRSGNRIIRPGTKQIRVAIERLAGRSLIGTHRTTRGLLITIREYEIYQNPANYGGYPGGNPKAPRKDAKEAPDIQERNNKNDKKGNGPPVDSFKSFYEMDCDRAGDCFEQAREEFLSDGNVKS